MQPAPRLFLSSGDDISYSIMSQPGDFLVSVKPIGNSMAPTFQIVTFSAATIKFQRPRVPVEQCGTTVTTDSRYDGHDEYG